MAACTSSAGATAAGCSARDSFALKPGSSHWLRIPGPTPREHLAAAAAGNRVYAIGGRAAGIDSNKTAFETYDAGARRWRALTPLPGARGGTGAAAIDGSIVSVGGEKPGGTIKPPLFAYDVRARRWSQLADLPTPRHGLGVSRWTAACGPSPAGRSRASP